MRVADVMNPDPVAVTPGESAISAAALMARIDVGSLPVCDGERLVGLVCGRDIAGRDGGDLCVAEVMQGSVRYLTEEDDPRAAELLMDDLHVRRMPVVDVERRLVGIVTRGDCAAVEAQAERDGAAAG